MDIKATIGDHVPAARSNDFLTVVDALRDEEGKRLRAAEDGGDDYITPTITFAVPADKVGPVKRQMREAAHLRDRTARLTEEKAHPSGKKDVPDEIALTYVLTDRIERKTAETTAETA